MTVTCYFGLKDFLTRAKSVLKRGPIAVVIAEDAVEIDSVLEHNARLGFATQIVLGAADLSFAFAGEAHHIAQEVDGTKSIDSLLNPLLKAVPSGVWIGYSYNAEYLFYPFQETRKIGDLVQFCQEERRKVLRGIRVDLYALDLGAHPDGIARAGCGFDALGYYALPRRDPMVGSLYERQIEVYGGLAWRHEAHLPKRIRRLERAALFEAQRGLKIHADHSFNIADYNTLASPWHPNPTAAFASFRLAKALRRNPKSRAAIARLDWQGTREFHWHSRDFLEAGLMEPGQWF